MYQGIMPTLMIQMSLLFTTIRRKTCDTRYVTETPGHFSPRGAWQEVVNNFMEIMGNFHISQKTFYKLLGIMEIPISLGKIGYGSGETLIEYVM